jgi:hypothetical protein
VPRKNTSIATELDEVLDETPGTIDDRSLISGVQVAIQDHARIPSVSPKCTGGTVVSCRCL